MVILMDRLISFPQMGNYYVPARYLFTKILSCDVLTPPVITKNTIELGSKYSPDFVCTPINPVNLITEVSHENKARDRSPLRRIVGIRF